MYAIRSYYGKKTQSGLFTVLGGAKMSTNSVVKKNRKRLDLSDAIIRGFGYIFVSFYALACVFPFLLIIGTSFSEEAA